MRFSILTTSNAILLTRGIGSASSRPWSASFWSAGNLVLHIREPERWGIRSSGTFRSSIAMTGEAARIIKPLYLARMDSTKLLTHGGQWVDKVQASP